MMYRGRDGDVCGPVRGRGLGQGPPLPAGHHPADRGEGGDQGRGPAHRDQHRPQARGGGGGRVPGGGDQVLVNTFRQSVGFPAASSLALESVLSSHPEPAVTSVLRPVSQFSGLGAGLITVLTIECLSIDNVLRTKLS